MTELADLTPKQIAVASLVAAAKSTKQIAAELALSERMVDYHITALAFLIDADPTRNTRVQLALWYRERVPITTTRAPSAA